MRSLLLAALLSAVGPAALAADLAAGQTLACASETPGRQLFAVVGKVEPFGAQTAVGISLYDRTPGARLPMVGHLPVDQEVLASSCKPQTAVTLPISEHFQSGYDDWRAAVAAQKAGVFTLTPDQIENMLLKQLPPATPAGSARQ